MRPTKVKIVGAGSLRHPNQPTFVSNHLEKYWSKDFIVETYDPTKHYDPDRDLIWVDRNNYNDQGQWIQSLQLKGFRIIFSDLWDNHPFTGPIIDNRKLLLASKNWFWFNEANLNQHRGYHHRRKHHSPNFFFLMLMNLQRPHRDFIYSDTKKYQERSLYSYVAAKQFIEGDSVGLSPNQISDRYFNPNWYANTCFSLVVETLIDQEIFVTEKTFKPLAFEHPAIIYGSPGTLKYLRDQGFATFDNVIDESYDKEPNIPYNKYQLYELQDVSRHRRQKILTILDDLYREFVTGNQIFQDSETKKRIDHNYHRFYDTHKLNQIWKEEIVDVISNFSCQ